MPRTIAIDFDGVIHAYTSGWKGARTIPDPPVPGALPWIETLIVNGFDVVVHSSRAAHLGGIWAMRRWLRARLLEYLGADQRRYARYLLRRVRFVRMKPPAHLTIDDRAIRFEGRFPYLDEIEAFRPYRVTL